LNVETAIFAFSSRIHQQPMPLGHFKRLFPVLSNVLLAECPAQTRHLKMGIVFKYLYREVLKANKIIAKKGYQVPI
jgi:hypothetical protein